ncbi:hypothetical protein JD969_20640 [Planctomycetota bacterium]|nr:hypothetical protein JD969_20640 [Planctomycetota bacterium]
MKQKPTKTYKNRLGRKSGRGMRPWFLIPKIISICAIWGVLLACAALILCAPDTAHLPAVEQLNTSRQLLTQITQLLHYLIIPALVLANIFGLLLFLDEPRIFIRLRWLQTKMLLIIIAYPILFAFLNTKLSQSQSLIATTITKTTILNHQSATIKQQPILDRAITQTSLNLQVINWSLLIILILTTLVIILGRHKPKLGQNWAKTYAKISKNNKS